MIYKDTLASEIAKRTKLNKGQSLIAIETLGEVIAEAIKKDESVQIVNFATFEPVEYNRTEFIIPNKGLVHTEALKRRCKVKLSVNFKKAINDENG